MILKTADRSQEILRNLSPQAFLALGVDQVAYIRPVEVLSHKAYALHAADGTPLTLIDSLEGAVVAARQNDLDAVTLQ
jgi:hypothetical protein